MKKRWQERASERVVVVVVLLALTAKRKRVSVLQRWVGERMSE